MSSPFLLGFDMENGISLKELKELGKKICTLSTEDLVKELSNTKDERLIEILKEVRSIPVG